MKSIPLWNIYNTRPYPRKVNIKLFVSKQKYQYLSNRSKKILGLKNTSGAEGVACFYGNIGINLPEIYEYYKNDETITENDIIKRISFVIEHEILHQALWDIIPIRLHHNILCATPPIFKSFKRINNEIKQMKKEIIFGKEHCGICGKPWKKCDDRYNHIQDLKEGE